MVDINENSSETQNDEAVLDTTASAENIVAEDKTPKPEKANANVVKASPLIDFIQKIKDVINHSKGEEVIKKSSPPKKAVVKQDSADINIPVKDENEVEEKTVYRGEPLMTVLMRNRFYRDGYRNLIKIVIAQAVIIALLIISFIAYMGMNNPEDRYFATTADGRIMRMDPLDRPNMSTSALMSWVAQSTSEVMTFGFHDYQTRLQRSSRHFTRNGWEGFTRALQRSKIVEAVTAASQVVTCKPRSAPILIQEGVFNGRYRWVIDIPLQVTYQSNQASRVDNLMVRLVIDRVSSLDNPHGVGIEQWIARAN